MLTKVSALELSKYNIKVNAISPGFTKTPLTQSIYPEEHKIWKLSAKYNPSGRIGRPTDIANAVLFLISDKAHYMNGENITIVGGSSLK